ncbi:MAG: ATP-binding protein [Gammaproteobacteria bacterium]|nr:ATP-binding protein [Gammaproteobacteria bacterium]
MDENPHRIGRRMPNLAGKPENIFVARHVEGPIRTALEDTRIVALVGPRQSGKTTLARRIAERDDRLFVTLDDDQARRFAQDDPAGFMRSRQTAVIDEIQRAPDLILALKKAVDEDPRPGRFLITGSVELFKGATSPDSLAGRVETIELLPFSQAELARGDPPTFVERAFAGDFDVSLTATGHARPTANLVERVVAGGYPEALSRSVATRRQNWLRSYARALAERDATEIATIGKPAEMVRLIDHMAVVASELVNMSKLGSRLGVDGKTVDRWLSLLEHMFLIRRIPAWHRSGLKRLVKAPKLMFLDSGLLAALRRTSVADVARDRQRLGPLLECFVHAELAKAVSLCEEPTAISHYRDKDRVEVDLVLTRSPGEAVGIEIKANATARPEDFRGLRRLQEALGDDFRCGILLHDGDRVEPVAPGLFAVPIDVLWSS